MPARACSRPARRRAWSRRSPYAPRRRARRPCWRSGWTTGPASCTSSAPRWPTSTLGALGARRHARSAGGGRVLRAGGAAGASDRRAAEAAHAVRDALAPLLLRRRESTAVARCRLSEASRGPLRPRSRRTARGAGAADARSARASATSTVRAATVSEGTPEGVQSPWGPGASGYKKDATKDANGDVGSEPTIAAADDPRETEQWDMQMIKADQAHQVTDGNRNVVVGVLDSGIDPDHPDLAPNIDVADSVNCTDAGRPDTLRHRLVPDHQRPRHPRRRHHRRRPQRRRHRRGRAERADGLGQGRQRRRLHLPRVRRVRLRLGRSQRHGRDEQQLYVDPFDVPAATTSPTSTPPRRPSVVPCRD